YFVQPRHFVPTDQVMIRMTSAPAQVVKAYRKADFNELRLALLTWFTGYLVANPGHSERHTKGIVWSEVIGALESGEIDVTAASQLQCSHPLSDQDINTIEPNADWLQAAGQLLLTRCPKWFVALRRFARLNEERTLIAAALPLVG